MDLTLKIFIEIIVQKVMVLTKLIRVKENKQYSSLRDWFQTEPIKNEEGDESSDEAKSDSNRSNHFPLVFK